MTKKMTTEQRKAVIGTQQQREFRIETRAVDEESRTVELAWSSETPYQRWWGAEVLDHKDGSVRLQRLTDGAPLLLQHDPDRQIGVVESVRIDKDKVGRATVRFSRSALGQEIMQDITDGVRSKVSVGYLIHDMVLEKSGDNGDEYRVTDWEPLEISVVSIPADNSVGVGRNHNPGVTAMPDPTKKPGDPATEPTATADPVNEPTARKADPVKPEPAAVQAPINPEAEQIRAVGRHFKMGDEAENHIMLGGSLQEFRDMVRKRQPDPVPVAPRVEARVPHAGHLRAYKPELYAGGRREAEEQAFRAGQWAKAVIFGDEEAARWCRDYDMPILRQRSNMQQRVLTGIGAGQSVVIPEEMALPIISLREQYGIARQLCYVHPMVTDTASVPRDAGDVTAYFVGRESAPNPNDPDFDNVNLTAKDVAAETRIHNSYADDSAINLADYVAEKHARAFAIKEDTCLFSGDGGSTYGGIVGLRTLLSAAGGLAGAVDAAANNDTFGEITVADLRKVMGALQDIAGIDPRWITSKAGQNNMFGRLTDAAGGNTKQNLSASMPEQYGGYAIVTSPAMPTSTGDLSDVVMAIFGDLRLGVIFGDRRGMTMMVDPYSLSSNLQTKIISSERFDINCHGVGTTTATGPIVALVGE